MVLIGPHNDGGWSQAHYEGLEYIQAKMQDVHTAYIENVPEGTDSEQVFRSLSRKGFDLVFGTSFGFMDPMETVAGEFPDITYIHISGYKSNSTNFGNLFGAMEDMKYLAGMLAGSRAKMDGNPKIGYMATFPIPEEIRLVPYEVAEGPDGRVAIRIDGKLRDLTGRDRAITLYFTYPVDATGWLWHDDQRRSRRIEGGGKYLYWDGYQVGPNWRASRLPFACLTGPRESIVLGAPLDVPRLWRFAYDADAKELYAAVKRRGFAESALMSK